MKYCTFRQGNRTVAGMIRGESVVHLGEAFFKSFRRPHRFDDLLEFILADGPARARTLDYGALRRDRKVMIPLEDVRLAAPIRRPPKIICVGLNYRAHAEEQGKTPPSSPMLFSKASNIVIGPGEEIHIPAGVSEKIDYEVELAAIIGTPGSRIPRRRALEHVFGYTILNDVTARDIQKGDRQWFRGKSMDTFAPMGPVVAGADAYDASDAEISLTVNGELRQDSRTSDLVFDVASLIEHISASLTLEAGDVISTGTPGGVGVYRDPPVWLKKGDLVEASIQGIGTLSNPVV